MKIPTNLFKFSFIALGWIVFILLCYVAFKDEKTNVLITMKDSLREAINIDYQERLNKILIHYRPLGRKVKGKHSASCVFFPPLFLPTFVASL